MADPAEKDLIMSSMLAGIGQLKDLSKSLPEPETYYRKVPKKNGQGFTFFYTKAEYDAFVAHRGGK